LGGLRIKNRAQGKGLESLGKLKLEGKTQEKGNGVVDMPVKGGGQRIGTSGRLKKRSSGLRDW